MDVNIICIGKLKEKYWKDACEEYSKRLSAVCRFSIIELAEARLPKDPSAGEIEKCLRDEGQHILEKCGSGSYVVALCIEGDIISSEKLASVFSSAALSGKNTINLIIGGSHGLSDQVKRRADLRISMGRMTFPHQLARVMLCEQVYRAFSINSGSKYHK